MPTEQRPQEQGAVRKKIFLLITGTFLCVDVCVSAIAQETRIYRAVESFSPVSEAGYAPHYAETRAGDPSLHGLAVDTVLYGDRPSAADLRFEGGPGQYDLILRAVAEEDGESRYAIAINGTRLPERTNPETRQKRLPVLHRWEKIALFPGDRIRVIFRGHSNRRIPEGEAFAWSRGRWRALELVALPPAKTE